MSAVSVKKESLKNQSSLSAADIAKPVASKVSSLLPRIKKNYSAFEKELKIKRESNIQSKTLNEVVVQREPTKLEMQTKAFFQWFLPPLFGILLLLAVWTLISHQSQNLPGPVSTFKAAVVLFSDPFYVNGPNDQGIGWNIIESLKRVGLGFGLAALIGIPLGFLIGRFAFISQMMAPIIGILKPVSPLAWLPIGLLVFKAANPAAIWVIFISAVWPLIINTAVGVAKVPQDYMNVAKVLNLSEWKIATKILLPSALPFIMTGVRLSIGVAWLVIVAAEMLTGGVGIGFWVWDEWNNLNVEHIIIAIILVGIIGLLLETILTQFAKKFSHEG
jgi:nitrate/nitrite transport system permease protein